MGDFSCKYGVSPFQIIVSTTVYDANNKFRFLSSNTEVAIIDSFGWVTVKNVGTTLFTIIQNPDQINLGATISSNLTVLPIPSFFKFTVPQRQYLDTSLNLMSEEYTQLNGSTGNIIYSIVNAKPDNVARIEGSVIIFSHPGTFQITAEQIDDGNYLGKTLITHIIIVEDAAFLSFKPINYVYSDVSYSLYDWTTYTDDQCVLTYSVVPDPLSDVKAAENYEIYSRSFNLNRLVPDPLEVTNISIQDYQQNVLSFNKLDISGRVYLQAAIKNDGNHSGNTYVESTYILGSRQSFIANLVQTPETVSQKDVCIQS